MSRSIRDRTATIMRMAGNIAPSVLAMEDRWSDQQDAFPDAKSVARKSVDYATAIVDEVLLRFPDPEER